MISYRHPYQALSNAQWTPFIRFNYTGGSDLEEVIIKKRKFSSDEGSDFMQAAVVNKERQSAEILDSVKNPEQMAKINMRRRKTKTTIFTIDALLGHLTESPSKKRKVQFTQTTKRKDDSIDSGFSSSEENDESIIASVDANDSGICNNDSRQEPDQIKFVTPGLPQPKVRSNQQLPPSERYNRLYMPINDAYHLYPGLNKVVQQNWMHHHQYAIPYAPIETMAFVGQCNNIQSNISYSPNLRPQKTQKTKRARTVFTQKQLERLEAEFNNQQYMVGNERRALSKKLRLTDAQVKVWFQNRRIKYRNDKKREPVDKTNKLDVLKREAIEKY
uniref:homeobox protein Hox-D12-like n=1 Tax=Styela clava TaxID=7725 RepID=UPI00193A7F22|nr:homeobox protein Hox-D12-like [Styela clava]